MKVQITIRGRRYTLRTDQDEDLRAIAAYVDDRMTEIANRGAALDEYSLAMLTALNIASEFERFRQEVAEELGTLDRDLASASLLLESALPGAAEDASTAPSQGERSATVGEGTG